MPYNKRKQKCKQSDGTPGNYVLSYTTKKGEKRSACHTSQKNMQGQIASIEAEAEEMEGEELTEAELRLYLRALMEKKKPGLWANINAKKKRGEKSNPKSKSYKAAKKAGEKINRQAKKKEVDEAVKEALIHHIENDLCMTENVFRPGSYAYFALIREARRLYNMGVYDTNRIEEIELFEDLEVGNFGYYMGKRVPLDFPIMDEPLSEAKYQGREVKLGKAGAQRIGGGKARVYVRDPKTKKVKPVTFGSSMPDAMGDSDAAKKRRKSFGDRHNCADKKDKTAPGYWSCRLTKMFGRNIAGWW